MNRINGVPVEQRAFGGWVTKRGGWPVSDDRDHNVFPGDVIEAPEALVEYDPRYIEHLSMFTDEYLISEGDDVIVVALDPDEPVHPCCFCSTKVAIAERGIIDADYELQRWDGTVLGYTCHACIAGAPTVGDD